MHALGSHHKHGLRCIEQPKSKPECAHPVPARLFVTAACGHIGHRTAASGQTVKNAVKRGFRAADGVASGYSSRHTSTHDQQSHNLCPLDNCPVRLRCSAEV